MLKFYESLCKDEHEDEQREKVLVSDFFEMKMATVGCWAIRLDDILAIIPSDTRSAVTVYLRSGSTVVTGDSSIINLLYEALNVNLRCRETPSEYTVGAGSV